MTSRLFNYVIVLQIRGRRGGLLQRMTERLLVNSRRQLESFMLMRAIKVRVDVC